MRRDSLVSRAYDLQEYLDSLSSKVRISALGMSQRQASHALDRIDTLIGYYRGLLNTPIASQNPPVSAEAISKGLLKLQADRMKIASELEQTLWGKDIIIDGFDDLLQEFGEETDAWSLPPVTITGEPEEVLPTRAEMRAKMLAELDALHQEAPAPAAEVQAVPQQPVDPNDPDDSDMSWFYGDAQQQPAQQQPQQTPLTPQEAYQQQQIAMHKVTTAESPNLVMNPQMTPSAMQMGIPVSQPMYHPKCPICNSQNRAVIENYYVQQEGDMMSTLDFISSLEPGRVLATVARMHFDDHLAKQQ
jgi:hypothetical protein